MSGFAGRVAGFLPLITATLIPAVALTIGLVNAASTPRQSGSTNLAAPAAVITIIVLITIIAASYGGPGILRRVLTAMTFGGVAGASLIVGDYLAFLAGLGLYAERDDWGGEAGRSLTGFIIASGVVGALLGAGCGVLAVFLRWWLGRLGISGDSSVLPPGASPY